MIEYALLFGLGFLTAALAGLLLAPAIHRRIVKFTENRIMATMPVSPQELRAQKDMVRAEMAAQIARAGHETVQERHRAVELEIKSDRLSAEASRLHSENFELRNAIQTLENEAGELRSSLRREEIRLDQMKQTVTDAERAARMKDSRIDDLLQRVQRLTMDIDNLKIDMATRDTEAESLRARINALRDERETLRNDVRLMTNRAKDAELRLAREENKAQRLEDKLNSEISGSVDKDTMIERRMSEISRLKERLKAANSEAREANRALKTSGLQKPVISKLRTVPVPGEAAKNGRHAKVAEEAPEAAPSLLPARMMSDEEAGILSDEVRSQASAVSDRLLTLKDASHDEALRAEIADIAAKMVAITAQKEGHASPVRSMISGKPASGRGGRVSLSERASRIIRQD